MQLSREFLIDKAESFERQAAAARELAAKLDAKAADARERAEVAPSTTDA